MRRAKKSAARLAGRGASALGALAGALLGGSRWSSAGVTRFDDLAAAPISNYGGFTWTNVAVANGDSQGGGYAAGVISPENVAYNRFADTAEFSSVNAAPFDLNSVYITAAWRDGLQVTLTGYNGADVVTT